MLDSWSEHNMPLEQIKNTKADISGSIHHGKKTTSIAQRRALPQKAATCRLI
jgi:hypothetical protein